MLLRWAGTAPPTIKLCSLKVGASAAEHISVALAKPLPPLGVYKKGWEILGVFMANCAKKKKLKYPLALSPKNMV